MIKNKFSKKIIGCQICSSKSLKSIMFYGYIPPVNSMDKIGSIKSENLSFPLHLVKCSSCHHVQIDTIVDKKVLFPYSYPYLSGTTKILKQNFYDLYKETKTIVGLGENDLVIDIGSNDGTLLTNFKINKIKTLGVEPSQAGNIANKNGIETIIDYFNDQTVKKILIKYKKPKLITATNVFAHIEDPNSLINLIKKIMTKDTVFVTESHYLLSLVKTLQYDTIYHEHLRYYHLSSLIKLFSLNNLEVFHAKKIPTHGGSIRVYSSKKGVYKKTKNLKMIMEQEKKSEIHKMKIFQNFKKKVINSKYKLLNLLIDLRKKKKTIFAIGAPSRASTLVNYVGIDNDLVEYILEVSGSNKINKYLPGTLIPVVDEKIINENPPDFLLILSWHIKDELMKIFKKKGFKGSFIVPLPKPLIVK